MKKILSKFLSPLKKYDFYRFVSFLYHQYCLDQKGLYKAEDFAAFGEGAFVDPGVVLTHPKRVILKEFSILHRGAFINSIGGLQVGRYSGIGYNCQIFTADHKIFKVASIPFDKNGFLKPVIIDDFVMIGANVCITPGVHIGEGAIIGMGAVVTRDVPPLAIMVGNPAEPVAYRDKTLFDKLKEEKAFQPQAVEDYTLTIQLMYRKKYKEFLSLIDMEDSSTGNL